MINGAPAEYQEPTRKIPLGENVHQLVYGNDGQLAIRFFIHAEYNAIKSKAVNFAIYDDIEMIEITIDKDNKPCHMVNDYYRERHARLYNAWKEGISSGATMVSDWKEASPGQAASLVHSGFHTVEQFAEITPERLRALPLELHELQEKAVQFRNSKSGKIDPAVYSEKIVDLEKKLVQQIAIAEKQQEMINRLSSMADAPKKKGGRPKKIVNSVVVEESEEN